MLILSRRVLPSLLGMRTRPSSRKILIFPSLVAVRWRTITPKHLLSGHVIARAPARDSTTTLQGSLLRPSARRSLLLTRTFSGLKLVTQMSRRPERWPAKSGQRTQARSLSTTSALRSTGRDKDLMRLPSSPLSGILPSKGKSTFGCTSSEFANIFQICPTTHFPGWSAQQRHHHHRTFPCIQGRGYVGLRPSCPGPRKGARCRCSHPPEVEWCALYGWNNGRYPEWKQQ